MKTPWLWGKDSFLYQFTLKSHRAGIGPAEGGSVYFSCRLSEMSLCNGCSGSGLPRVGPAVAEGVQTALGRRNAAILSGNTTGVWGKGEFSRRSTERCPRVSMPGLWHHVPAVPLRLWDGRWTPCPSATLPCARWWCSTFLRASGPGWLHFPAPGAAAPAALAERGWIARILQGSSLPRYLWHFYFFKNAIFSCKLKGCPTILRPKPGTSCPGSAIKLAGPRAI